MIGNRTMEKSKTKQPRKKKEKDSIGTTSMHPMALAHLKGQKAMKKAVKEIRRKKI
jgi:hypothetical protein